MSSPPTTQTGSDSEYRNVPVSVEFRDKLRVAKAEQGVSYEEYLRENLSL